MLSMMDFPGNMFPNGGAATTFYLRCKAPLAFILNEVCQNEDLLKKEKETADLTA